MSHTAPTVPPPEPDSLSAAMRRNIRVLEERRQQDAARAPFEARVADAITRFTGSMMFV